MPNPEISKIAGHLWASEPDHVKEEWKKLAEVSGNFVLERFGIGLTGDSRKRKPVTLSSIQTTDSSLDISLNDEAAEAYRARAKGFDAAAAEVGA